MNLGGRRAARHTARCSSIFMDSPRFGSDHGAGEHERCKIVHNLLSAPDVCKGATIHSGLGTKQSSLIKPSMAYMPAPAQASDWARPGTEAIAALVDLSATEVRELLAAPDEGLGFSGGGSTSALAQRVARLLAALEGALAHGAGPAASVTGVGTDSKSVTRNAASGVSDSMDTTWVLPML